MPRSLRGARCPNATGGRPQGHVRHGRVHLRLARLCRRGAAVRHRRRARRRRPRRPCRPGSLQQLVRRPRPRADHDWPAREPATAPTSTRWSPGTLLKPARRETRWSSARASRRPMATPSSCWAARRERAADGRRRGRAEHARRSGRVVGTTSSGRSSSRRIRANSTRLDRARRSARSDEERADRRAAAAARFGAGRRPQGRAHGRRRRRDGAAAVARLRMPRSRLPAAATCWPARSDRCWRRESRRTTRHAWACICTAGRASSAASASATRDCSRPT